MEAISTAVTLVVLFSALIHASWNAVLKSGSQKLIDATLMSFFGGIFCFIAIMFLPIVNVAAWPYIISSAIIHVVYFVCLANAYKHSDLSHAYPLIRGMVPPFVALFAFLIIGEELSLAVLGGIFLISIGVLLPGKLNKGEITLKSTLYIASTAACIIAYTMVDGTGVRLSGNAASYVTYMSFIEAIILVVVMLFYIGKKDILSYASSRWMLCAIAGIASILGYGLVLWAMNQAPIGVVSALRETSIIFGTLIGIYFFKEKYGKKRLLTALFICLGVFLIKMY